MGWCFNSLQTGNCIQTKELNDELEKFSRCFNSLQTGNCIQTSRTARKSMAIIRVSIPFKRETAFKPVKPGTPSQGLCTEFQFPSNGKLHSNLTLIGNTFAEVPAVSIPFKRETAFKLTEAVNSLRCSLSFNSLQTGNCIQTSLMIHTVKVINQVSIPFKRETAFKRAILSRNDGQPPEFQFPSNGKLHSNCIAIGSA